MSSIIKVNTYQDANGNALFSSDGSGTVTLDSNFSGVLPSNTPAFHAYPSATTSVPTGTSVKVQANTEVLDTDNCYDNTTNYRFTPTTAGKYFCYVSICYNLQNSGVGLIGELRKNGTEVFSCKREDSSYQNFLTAFTSGIIEFNGSTDYLEFYTSTSSSLTRTLDNDEARVFFGAYKLIGA